MSATRRGRLELAALPVREGHGVAAADALAGPTPALQDSDGTVERPYYVHFRLSDKATPMSWVLSRRAISRLSSEWEAPQNQKEREKLDKIMCWGPPPNRCQSAP